MHASRPVLALLLVCLFTAPSAARASVGPLQPGDIVVPGNRVVDGFGNVDGVIFRIRGGVATTHFESAQYVYPRDMVVDDQGRLVFFATPQGSGNVNDTGLFRIDPATGALERLRLFRYIVQSGDTIPQGAAGATNFTGAWRQSLHLQKSYGVRIADDENGGWPQVQAHAAYGFSMATYFGATERSMSYRYLPDDGSCAEGISTALLGTTAPAYMAGDSKSIWYGINSTVGKTAPPTRVSLHFSGSWGEVNASADVFPKNELILNGGVLDNTLVPNVSVDCGEAGHDDNVPMQDGGFGVVSMSGLGVLDGQLYDTSNSGAQRGPYLFNYSARDPYLNPYVCAWGLAQKGAVPLGFWLEDGTPTAADFSSPDGGSLLVLGNGVIKQVTPGGEFSILHPGASFTGRPWRWNGPSSIALASEGAALDAAPDSSQLLVVRADSLVNVKIVDSLGRRLGFDAAGNTVNDFGDAGVAQALGPGGWPRVLVLRDPPPGVFTAEVASGAAGNWGVTAYLAHSSAGSLKATRIGSAGGAGTQTLGLYVGQPLGLTWYASPLAVESRREAGFGFVSVGPVPSRGTIRFTYRVPEAGTHMRLEIYDLAGRAVATPLDAGEPAGLRSFTWDGNGRDGRALAPGVYLARLAGDDLAETRRIVVTQ